MAATRRLEDRIRELAVCLACAPDGELLTIMRVLQVALNEYMQLIEEKTSATVLAWPGFPRDRRSAHAIDTGDTEV